MEVCYHECKPIARLRANAIVHAQEGKMQTRSTLWGGGRSHTGEGRGNRGGMPTHVPNPRPCVGSLQQHSACQRGSGGKENGALVHIAARGQLFDGNIRSTMTKAATPAASCFGTGFDTSNKSSCTMTLVATRQMRSRETQADGAP